MSTKTDLIAKYLNGAATDEDVAALEQLLQNNSSQVDELAQLLQVSSDLREHFADETAAQKLSPLTTATEFQSLETQSAWKRGRLRGIVWGVAVSLAAWFAASLWSGRRLQEDVQRVDLSAVADARNSQSPAADRVVACLGRTFDCVWTSAQVAEGTQLSIGSQVGLATGVAEVIFDNGARVQVQGPCELYVDDAQSCSLGAGNASVSVPETAFGFKVVTPSGIIVDLGTEFGIAVDDEGSEVHVFKGEVAFQALTTGGKHFEKAIRVTADRACQYAIRGTTLHEFEANEGKFDWRTRRPLSADEAPPLPARDGLALWLAADRQVDCDADGRIHRWQDLLVGDNDTAEDALQVNPEHRPQLVDDAVGGKPAVRFNHGAFLLTPPLGTTNEQTAFVVMALRGVRPTFQSVLNYNGPPQRIVGPLGGRVQPAVFEICLRDRNANGLFAACGELFGGFKDGGKVEVIKSVVEDFDRVKTAVPLAVAFRYSLQEQRMSLFVNGEERASGGASTPIAVVSRKILGRHPIFDTENGDYDGDLAEVLLYNRALGDAEVLQVSRYLEERYGLAKSAVGVDAK